MLSPRSPAFGRLGTAAAGLPLAVALACGSDDPKDNTFGDPSGGSGGSTLGGSAGTGAVIGVGGSGNTPGFDAAGGTNWNTGGTGQGGNGQGGGAGCIAANCPPPPAPAVPCCIVDLCGGDWGQGCQPFEASGGSGGGVPVHHPCNDPPPPGAQVAAPPPAYGGVCPQLVDSAATGADNVIVSSGNQRHFKMAVPGNLDPSEQLPVVFLWHWLGGDGINFLNKASAAIATNQERFIAIFPEAKGDLPLKWPYAVTDVGRLQEEFKFFDDMYACVAQQFNVQPNCIATGGVSAGALFTDQLAQARSQYFSSFMSMSGGTGQEGILPWIDPAHKAPAVVLWGGPGDFCGLAFEPTSKDLENQLTAGGHFMIECVHNCGHSEPPFPKPDPYTKYHVLWQFVFDHPYWLGAGQSPYNQSGLPAGWPSWCGIGIGSAGPASGLSCQGLAGCL
jgi:predicted esterase